MSNRPITTDEVITEMVLLLFLMILVFLPAAVWLIHTVGGLLATTFDITQNGGEKTFVISIILIMCLFAGILYRRVSRPVEKAGDRVSLVICLCVIPLILVSTDMLLYILSIIWCPIVVGTRNILRNIQRACEE